MNFDTDRFLKDKELVVADSRYKEGTITVTLIVMNDKTIYSDDSKGVNDFEKFTLKIENTREEDLNKLNKKQRVKVVNVKGATVWGDYMQNLTVYGQLQFI